jgi:hypothetical protein
MLAVVSTTVKYVVSVLGDTIFTPLGFVELDHAHRAGLHYKVAIFAMFVNWCPAVVAPFRQFLDCSWQF